MLSIKIGGIGQKYRLKCILMNGRTVVHGLTLRWATDALKSCRRLLAASALGIACTSGIQPAWAYNGDSFLSIPDAAYNSMRRNADGLYDPASGECHGLSMAYEVDTVPAFLTPLPPEEIAAARGAGGKNPSR
jgi:hypothetical protein